MVLGTVIWYDRDVHVPVSGTKKTRQKRNQFYRFGFVFSKSILFFSFGRVLMYHACVCSVPCLPFRALPPVALNRHHAYHHATLPTVFSKGFPLVLNWPILLYPVFSTFLCRTVLQLRICFFTAPHASLDAQDNRAEGCNLICWFATPSCAVQTDCTPELPTGKNDSTNSARGAKSAQTLI